MPTTDTPSPTSPLAFRKLLRALVLATVAAGCASAPIRRPAAERNPVIGSSSDIIGLPELSRLSPGLSVMDAVEHVRPWFLRPRGSVSTASVDGSPPSDVSVLSLIPVSHVKEVRLLRGDVGAPVAHRPDGTVVVGDVILVTTRTGGE